MCFLRSISILMVIVVCVSCATPYQRMRFTGGYQEDKIDEDSYIVSFYGNGYTSEEKVWNFWFYRCAEVTAINGYEYFTVTPIVSSATAIDSVPKYTEQARIDMYNAPIPKNVRSLLSARTIMDSLDKFVKTYGRSEAPDRKALVMKAIVDDAASRKEKINESSDL